jgi:hypothetical protein
MNDEMICTGIYTQVGNRRQYWDDPKQRQHAVARMTPKQKEKFAKFYVSRILEAKEQLLWFGRMTDPELYRLYKESSENPGGK